jgi:hypothetical protein
MGLARAAWDHGVSEAGYLSDPDDSLALVNLPLDVDALLSAA